VIEEGAEVSAAAHVGAFVVVGGGTRIEECVILHPHVVIGRECHIGRESVLFPHVTLYDGTLLGARVTIHSGTVIGADGFGFAEHGGSRVKLPHVGRVVLEDDVEIGANSAVDRATLDETRIGAGSKLDNLVQVGHNVRIGRGAILCGQSGVSGSARLGDRVLLAGQSGVAGHLELGDDARLAGKSAAFKSVPAGQTAAGVPAVPAAKWRRQVAALAHLEDLRRRIGRVEREVAKLGAGREEGKT
jgi:UDP-3-O-[3-hydroxymyristoyl] glucosamine N-acyltransferase